jgi:hypothetical protein
MRKFTLPFSISVTLLVISLLSSAAQAQATRTWVSGVGDDANPCSRTAPCKTLAGAISKTAPSGEIDALNPGGFGALTITESITIDGGGGQVASVLVSGTNGIVIAAGATDVVTLRNLRINGIISGTSGGIDGIHYASGGDLHVENCYIFGFTGDGIDVVTNGTVTLFVTDTFLTNNKNGIEIAPSGGNARSTLVRVQAQGNSQAGFLLDPSTAGASTIISDSSAAGNGTGIAVTGGRLFLGNSVIAKNNVGVSITGDPYCHTRPI